MSSTSDNNNNRSAGQTANANNNINQGTLPISAESFQKLEAMCNRRLIECEKRIAELETDYLESTEYGNLIRGLDM
jgi:hypothetical protein